MDTAVGLFAGWPAGLAGDGGGGWRRRLRLPLINGPSVGVPQPGSPALAFSLSMPRPNPFRGATRLEFGLTRPGRIELDVFDLGGRRVKRLASGEYLAQHYGVTWTGHDDTGAPLAAGVYFARLKTEEGVRLTRVLLAR